MEFLLGFLGSIFLILIALFIQSPFLLFGLAFGIAGAVVFWYWYEYTPMALILLLAFSVEIQVTGATRLTVPTEPFIVLLFLMAGAQLYRRPKIHYHSSPQNRAVIFLYLIMVLSLVISQSQVSTIKAFIRDTGYIVTAYYLIPRYIDSEKRLKQLVIGCLIAHSLLTLYGFGTQAVMGIRIYSRIANPFFIEHCIYAAFLVITFSFVLAYYLDLSSGPVRNGLGIITAVIGCAIILTFVRAAWFSVVILLIYYLTQFHKRKSAVDLIIILLMFLIAGLILLLTTDLGTMFLQRFDTLTDLHYVANYDRLDRWIAAWEMWKDNPILGVGWGAYPDLYPYYSLLPGAYSSQIRMGAHNLYLELMAETGIVGISVFFYLIYTFFYQSVSIKRRARSSFYRVFLIGMQGAMITYLIHAFLNNLGPSDKMGITFWFLLGMVPTMRFLVDEEIESQPVDEYSESLQETNE